MKTVVFTFVGVCLLFSIPYTSEAEISFKINSSKIDYALEPILVEDIVLFIGDNRLTFWRWGEKPVYLSEKANIVSPSLLVRENFVVASWVEKRSDECRAVFRISQNRGKTWSEKKTAIKGKIDWFRILLVNEEYLFLYSDFKNGVIGVGIKNGEGNIVWNTLLEESKMIYSVPSIVSTSKGIFLFFSTGFGGKFELRGLNIRTPEEKVAVKSNVDGFSFVSSYDIGGVPTVISKFSSKGEIKLSIFRPEGDGFKEDVILRGEDVATAQMVYIPRSGEIVVFSSEIPGKTKQRVYLVRELSEGKKISRLDRTFDNAFAWLPGIAFGDNVLFAVWEDSRRIRRAVYGCFSINGGKEWRKDFLISPAKNYSFRPKISFYRGSFYVSWYQFVDDALSEARIAFLKVSSSSLESLSKSSKEINPENNGSLLRKRVEAYWKTMIARDTRRAYTFYDPFFRAKVSYEGYASRLGSILYYRANIKDFEIKGPEAKVSVNLLYEIKDLQVGGNTYSSGKLERTVKDTWIFVDGNWHKKFINPLTEGTSINY